MKNILENKLFIVIFTLIFVGKAYKIIKELSVSDIIFFPENSFAYSLGVWFSKLLIVFAAIIYLKIFIQKIILSTTISK